MRLIVCMLVIALSACKNGQKSDTASPELKQKLAGSWTDGTNQNAIFDITGDSIYYPELTTLHRYDLAGDTIRIQYPYYTYNGKISFEGDTLVITDGNGTNKYWKFKK
jgi:hypothetical protein